MEMLKARKEQLQKRGVSGFTLMEMLIVIAIIAILVAIAIPVFTTQLNNARDNADKANGRALYAQLMADYADNGKYDGTISADLTAAGNITYTINSETSTYYFNNGCTTTHTDGAAPTVKVTLSGTGDKANYPATTS